MELFTLNQTVSFELEYENFSVYNPQNKEKLDSLLGEYGLIHADGSLNNGFECSSHINHVKDFLSISNLSKWNILFDRLNSLNVESKENTGMHVHTGRQNLTENDIEKINYFIFSSQKLMDTIGGRTENHWCFFARNTLRQIKEKSGPKYCYCHVSKAETIEFRFFKTPLTVNGFLKNMQFICAILEFIKRDNQESLVFRNKASKNFYNFLSFVEQNKQYYSYLFDFLTLPENKKKIENKEIAPEKELNCDLYPTIKVKHKLSKLLAYHNGNSNGVEIKEFKNLINHVNKEKAAKTYEFLEKVINRAKKRKVNRIYFNGLPYHYEKYENPNPEQNTNNDPDVINQEPVNTPNIFNILY